jgi:hypothetical protein
MIDTLGEITVLALAGHRIYAMLDHLHLTGTSHNTNGRLWDHDMHPVVGPMYSSIYCRLRFFWPNNVI